MDAETIKREASAALDDLEIDSTVSDVTHSGDNWCVQFSSDYGQLCDSFQNQFKRDNSARVIREKIKKHLLGQITQLRNKGGRRTTKRGFGEEEQPDIGALVTDAFEQTSRAIGQAIDKTLGFTGESIKSAGDFAETVGTRTTEMLQRAPAREPAQVKLGNLARVNTPEQSRKKAKPRVTTKEASKKAASKTGRASAAKKAKSGKAKTKKGQKVKRGNS